MRLTAARSALLIATSDYVDSEFRQLRAAKHDVSELADVLGNARIGGYSVQTKVNSSMGELAEEIEDFCADRHPDDELLIYFSCHGVLDSNGRLYYAAANTRRQRLAATALASRWINERLEDCRARHQIVILDCCHSGAFARGSKGDADLDLHQRFRPQGRGRVVFTASRGSESAFASGQQPDDALLSVFTRAIIDGLRTGDADRDKDGFITVSDLYRHVYDDVRKVESRQTPELWTYGIEGDLLIAYSVRGPVIEPAPLPEDLDFIIASPRPRIRTSAVAELAELLSTAKPALRLTVEQTLRKIADTDISEVAEPARIALANHNATAVSVMHSAVAERIHGSPSSNREAVKEAGEESSSSASKQSALRRINDFPHRFARPRAVKDDRSDASSTPISDSAPRKSNLVGHSQEAVYIPLVGRISAGLPVLAEQSIEDAFPLPRQLVGNGTLFMLGVVGEPMVGAAILNGDFVVVRQQQTAESGEIVAALIEDEAALRIFKHQDGQGWLVPDNPTIEASVPISRAAILGRVVTVLRRVEGGLTLRQRGILQVIKESTRSFGRSPSVEELEHTAHLSAADIKRELLVMENKGYLQRDSSGSPVIRGQVRESSDEQASVMPSNQLISPQEFLQNEAIEGLFPIPRQLVGDGALFMIRLGGDAMTGSAIKHGDWVVVRQDAMVGNGDIIAAMVDDNVVIRTFYRSGDSVMLFPSNSEYHPISGQGAMVLGRVVAVLRRL